MEAATREDSAELLATLEAALVRVRGEFSSTGGAPQPVAPAQSSGDLARRCLTTLADLLSQRSLFAGDLEATVRRITEAASTTLDIERVSIWFFDPPRTKIVCADLFERAKSAHTAGTELFAKDFAPYFEALDGERTLAAHDANADPRTRCFSEPYLKPLGIGALLDIPIWASGVMAGVICHEHIGNARRWLADEETFAHSLSSLVALTLEQRRLVHPSLCPAADDVDSAQE